MGILWIWMNKYILIVKSELQKMVSFNLIEVYRTKEYIHQWIESTNERIQKEVNSYSVKFIWTDKQTYQRIDSQIGKFSKW